MRFISPIAENNNGFTLIEVISVLVIISVLGSMLIPRFLEIDTTSKQRAIDVGISELNGRETLTWALVKISRSGYQSDQNVWDQLKLDPGTDLGDDYDWPTIPGIGGGTLRFKREISVPLTRAASSIEIPGKWNR
jgi:prepilin-type N-terminal cleavage/methylation domain-containing protein